MLKKETAPTFFLMIDRLYLFVMAAEASDRCPWSFHRGMHTCHCTSSSCVTVVTIAAAIVAVAIVAGIIQGLGFVVKVGSRHQVQKKEGNGVSKREEENVKDQKVYIPRRFTKRRMHSNQGFVFWGEGEDGEGKGRGGV